VKAAILGMGQWLPSTVRTNAEWPADFAAHSAASAHRELADVRVSGRGDEFDSIVTGYLESEAGDPFLGSKVRRIADDSMTSREAEALAAEAALADAGVPASEIDFVLSWSLVPDRPMPPSGPWVAHHIGATNAFAIGVDVACASVVAQLLFAASLIESGRAAKVLITDSHLATRTFPIMHPASPSVGDAATALVVGASERGGVLASYGVSHGEYYDAVAWRRGKDEDTPWYRAGGPMHMGSYDRDGVRRIVQDTVRFGADTVREALKKARLPVSDLAVIASVQPRRWIPTAIARALGLAEEVAPQTFDSLAHLAGCGVVTNLIEARRRGLLSPERSGGEPPLVCMYAQGAGFTRASVLLRWVSSS
jgi:3-oxoacyl-[acyl-carrier-protein] synthase III